MLRSVILLACVLALAGCGSSGGPPIDATLATKLANQADAIAAKRDPCAARTHARILQRQLIDAINAGRIPAAYLEPLQSRVNEIAAAYELRCLPTPSTESAAPPAVSVSPAAGGYEKKHGKKKHGGGGYEGGD